MTRGEAHPQAGLYDQAVADFTDRSAGFVLVPARTSYPADVSQRYEEVCYEVAQRTEPVGATSKSNIDAALGPVHQVIDTIDGIDSARTTTTSTPGTGHRAPGR